MINKPIRWSESAKDCYNRQCRCDGCSVFKIIGRRCQMKKAVIEIVKVLGVPNGKQ